MTSPDIHAHRLPAKHRDLLSRLASVLGRERFVLFGGAPLDLLALRSRPVKDLDVALPLDPAAVQPCVDHLRACGCSTNGEVRRYWINLDQPVLMVDVRWENYLIDLNFVDEIERIPQFDIESVIWRYPELDYLDIYGAFGALAARTLLPVHGLASNNPYLLLNRLVRLAAKYDLSLADNPLHLSMVRELSRRIRGWTANDDFHGRQAREAHHRSVAASTLRAKDPPAYLADLACSGALQESIPELHRLLCGSPASRFQLAGVTTPEGFWVTALSLMPATEACRLSDRLEAARASPYATEETR